MKTFEIRVTQPMIGYYYFDELKETEKILEELLKPENERGEYYYQSSW